MARIVLAADMDIARWGSLRAGVGLVLAFAACGGGVAHDAPGAAGVGSVSGDSGVGGVFNGKGEGAGGRRTTPSTPAGPAGAGPAGAGAGGSGGEQLSCEGGLQVLRTISASDVIAWPQQQRVAFRTPAGTIQIHDVSAVANGGALVRVAELSVETFGLPKDWIINLPLEYGDGVLVTASRAEQTRVFTWHDGTGVAELAVSLPSRFFVRVADPDAGLAFFAEGELHRAIEHAGTWVIGARIGTAQQSRTPLAFDGDDLLVGLEESARPSFSEGEAGSGGEGGSEAGSGGDACAPSGSSAKLERWNSAGELVASYPAVGNPRVATPAQGGWLIGETNSFWGSYEAALEWLSPAKDQLRTLTHVPVRSSGDGEDGAFGVAVSASRVFVANCESGLLYGKWQGNAVELTGLGKEPEFDHCDPTSVHAIGELLVIGGEQLTFARLCDE